MSARWTCTECGHGACEDDYPLVEFPPRRTQTHGIPDMLPPGWGRIRWGGQVCDACMVNLAADLRIEPFSRR